MDKPSAKKYLVEFWDSHDSGHFGRGVEPVYSVNVVSTWEGGVIQKAREQVGYFGRNLQPEVTYMGEADVTPST
jgi:hypothetical protein